MSGEGTCFNSSLTPSPGELRPQQMDQSAPTAQLFVKARKHTTYMLLMYICAE